MITPEYVRLMSAYAVWQNGSLVEAAQGLDDEARRADRGAFFRSIHGTLEHLLWADQLWLHRLAGTPAPASPGIPGSVSQYGDWSAYVAARREMDGRLTAWGERVRRDELEGMLAWHSGALGRDVTRPRAALVIQLFNHGTHHRGQVHAMLTAAGARPGDTDVPFMPQSLWPWPGGPPAGTGNDSHDRHDRKAPGDPAPADRNDERPRVPDRGLRRRIAPGGGRRGHPGPE